MERKNRTGERFGRLIILEMLYGYKNKQTYARCKCDCGNQLEVRSGNLLREHTRSCGCKKRSKYEDLVEKYLLDSQITYHREYKFDDCKDQKPLPFDFYLPDVNGVEYCIECQGQQHYMPVKIFGGEERFAVYQLHDEIKRQYCLTNHITLIELPYSLSNQEATEKLDSILNPVTTTVV